MADKKTNETKPAKKKPRGGNSPVIGDNGMMTEPGDNAKFIQNAMTLGALPKIDLNDSEAVAKRITEYFQIQFECDLKPTVSGLGLALGLSRQRLWEIKTGNYHTSRALSELPTASTEAIKKGYEYMEILWENYMQNGKINPVSGIFLGKNNFGYTDKQEHVITPNTNSDSEYNTDDIKQRYLTDSPTIEQLPDFSDSEEV